MALYTRALAKNREIGHDRGQGNILDSIGSLDLRLGRPAEAIDHHLRALRIILASGNVAGQVAA